MSTDYYYTFVNYGCINLFYSNFEFILFNCDCYENKNYYY